MANHAKENAPPESNAGGDSRPENRESERCPRVQSNDIHALIARCTEASARRLRLACEQHPAGQAGVARALGFSEKRIKRFNEMCLGRRAVPGWVYDALAEKCPRVFSHWKGQIDEAFGGHRIPAKSATELAGDVAKETGEAISAVVRGAPKAEQVKEVREAEAKVIELRERVEADHA